MPRSPPINACPPNDILYSHIFAQSTGNSLNQSCRQFWPCPSNLETRKEMKGVHRRGYTPTHGLSASACSVCRCTYPCNQGEGHGLTIPIIAESCRQASGVDCPPVSWQACFSSLVSRSEPQQHQQHGPPPTTAQEMSRLDQTFVIFVFINDTGPWNHAPKVSICV